MVEADDEPPEMREAKVDSCLATFALLQAGQRMIVVLARTSFSNDAPHSSQIYSNKGISNYPANALATRPSRADASWATSATTGLLNSVCMTNGLIKATSIVSLLIS